MTFLAAQGCDHTVLPQDGFKFFLTRTRGTRPFQSFHGVVWDEINLAKQYTPLLTPSFAVICSTEHGTDFSHKALASPNPFAATQATQAGPATGIEFMAEAPLKSLKAIVETIREQADYALKQLQDVEEQRSMRWKCKDCEYIKHFTRSVPLEAAVRCPRCKSTSFEALQ